jgi:hypothetical protein
MAKTKLDGEERATVAVMMRVSQRERVLEFCRQEDVTMSQVIRKAVEQFLRNAGL